MDTELEATLPEVLAEMDDLGRAKWDAALARVENRKLRTALAEARNAATVAALVPDGPPPAGEPDDPAPAAGPAPWLDANAEPTS